MASIDSRKTVLITGCSPGGIGHALALEFHARGLQVFATARNASTIADLAAIGIETLSLEVDRPDQVEACRDEVARLLGNSRGDDESQGMGAGRGLDYLVNNAGRNYTMPALHATLSEIEATFRTNVFAVMHICATFTPLLIRSRGTIVQIGSVAGVIPYVFGSVYNASKAALHSYSDTLRVELAPFGVNVITVVTGGVKSNIARTERALPDGPGSLYKPMEKQFQRRQKHSQEVGMDSREYVRQVVSKVLAGDGWIWKRRTIWAGGNATLVARVWSILGVDSGFWDWIMTRMFGLKVLYKRGTENGKKEL